MSKRVNQNSLSHSMAVLPRLFRDILLLRPLPNESEKTDLGSSILSDWPDQLRNPDNYKRASCAARGFEGTWPKEDPVMEFAAGGWIVQALLVLFAVFGGERSKTGSFRRRSSRD
ncbi:uncharacterized protein RAG0_12021 [Rhynchosporium agropyri]|uniref:Uncharacterized protein n=1 Tax=Rhynchosporium agropyri TaxID=914238 RepID=A0A1E1L701_9HELO|nr:uncharacterized protein RAG0_12021 [Rhynchosporium agropyri]